MRVCAVSQRAGSANGIALDFRGYSSRFARRLFLPYSGDCPQTRRMADASGEYCNGSAHLRPAAIRRQRVFGFDRIIPKTGGVSEIDLQDGLKRHLLTLFCGQEIGPWKSELRVGRYQKHLALATLLGTLFSGFEALYSHYKNNFRYAAQWTPIVIAPVLMVAAGASIKSPKAARTWLPALSFLAIADGAVGSFYHARGVLRRPGGSRRCHSTMFFTGRLFLAIPGFPCEKSLSEMESGHFW